MYAVRNRCRALGGRPVTSVANQFAIAASAAAIDQSTHQTKWGIASRRRKKTVRRERRKSSVTVKRTKGSAIGGLCVEIEARRCLGVITQVLPLAGERARAEVDGAVPPDAPDRRGARLAVRARGDDPVVARCAQPLVGPAPREHALVLGRDAVVRTEFRPAAAHRPGILPVPGSEEEAAPRRQGEQLLER